MAGKRCWAESRAVGRQWQQRWAVEGVQAGILLVRSRVAEALDEVPPAPPCATVR
ncbi:hypothetical protein G6038_06590 [Rhodococcus sp. 14C212]|uniref:hypothetical protein n=1 Tax=Rhodococcus sp. 14C212 TaxID=2711209 RepID=UPI0013ED9CC8|nr:hypothetical protein [Rhodococcus sp. 14C212]NGP05155.1 hypothetical protein [Rhodococcus sp. 14C212]